MPKEKVVGFEDLFDEKEDFDSDLEDWEKDEISNYWIHRTICLTLYFNPNYCTNGCPMIITERELEEYVKQGKNIFGCTSLNVLYSDAEVKEKVKKQLHENNSTFNELEIQMRNKLMILYKSFIDNGIYMPDVYHGKIERTATQHSVEHMRKLINLKNFGFNSIRGEWNIGIILDIPLEEKDKVLKTLSTPVEYGTEYYGETKISQVISPKYIKGIVAKFGNEVFYLKNNKYMNNNIQDSVKNEENEELLKNEKKEYLYQTEKLFDMVLSEYLNEKSLNKKASDYVKRVNFIENEFHKQVMQTNGFPGSERHKQVTEFLKQIPRFKEYEKDEKLGDYINQVNEKKYYEDIGIQINKYISKLPAEKIEIVKKMKSEKNIDSIFVSEEKKKFGM